MKNFKIIFMLSCLLFPFFAIGQCPMDDVMHSESYSQVCFVLHIDGSTSNIKCTTREECTKTESLEFTFRGLTSGCRQANRYTCTVIVEGRSAECMH